MEKTELLERSEQLSTLAEPLRHRGRDGPRPDGTRFRRGRIGKTSLVAHSATRQGSDRSWGGCDAFFTPVRWGRCSTSPRSQAATSRTPSNGEAGPTRSPPRWAACSRSAGDDPGPRGSARGRQGHVDVFRLLARASTASRRWRSPPTGTSGSIAGTRCDRAREVRPLARDRLRRAPLSREAVVALAAPHGATPKSSTSRRRQPVLRHRGACGGGQGIPATVRDAVLGRAARLSPEARMLLDAIAVAGSQAELWLLGRARERRRA